MSGENALSSTVRFQLVQLGKKMRIPLAGEAFSIKVSDNELCVSPDEGNEMGHQINPCATKVIKRFAALLTQELGRDKVAYPGGKTGFEAEFADPRKMLDALDAVGKKIEKGEIAEISV